VKGSPWLASADKIGGIAMKQCPTCAVRFYEKTALCPIDGARLLDLPDPLVGRVIQERYLVEELIGTGGMGSVYRGRHQVINRKVALKFLASKHARDENSRQRFLREARAVNRVQHEHIIDVSDFGETDDGLVYIVMEFLSGRTLAEDIAQGRMPLARCCHIGLQLAFALGHAHELGVVHRDIKPPNVFLIRKGSENDFVKLLDFGLARAPDDVVLTKSNLLFGTPEYMAPEQASNSPVGAKADLYAFGCVLFEMITGRLPFEGAPTGLIYKHVYEPPPRPKQLRPEVPAALEALVLKLLSKAPERRPGSAYEVADELRTIRQGLPQNAGQVSARPSARAHTEPAAGALDNEEDLWNNNLVALQARIVERYRNTDPPQSVKAAMRRVSELVSDAQTLRKSLADIDVGATLRHDSNRGAQLRIGAAIDSLAVDEARAAQELEALTVEQKGVAERLARDTDAVLVALAAHDSAADGGGAQLSGALLAALRAWAAAQKQLNGLSDRLTEREVARADLRFQISHLKGRLGSLEAESNAELGPSLAKANQLQLQLSAKLAAIRNEAERITEQLAHQPMG
jgi:serine/threonine-protein kinase